jgi:hypothetical protein
MNPEDFRRSKCGQIRGTPENMQADVLGSEKGHLPFEKRRLRGTCPSFTVIAIDSFLKGNGSRGFLPLHEQID